MSIDKQEFEMMIERQIENEKRAVRLLQSSTKKTANTVIKLMLNKLALDSTKHEIMLRAILQLLKSPPEERFRYEGEEFRKAIEKHVEIERKMLEDFERIVGKTADNRIRFIVQDIISDEKKHHVIMKRVHELICEGEKVQDQEWWDFLFRYSRLTG